jgi:hypothetical protein
MANEQEYIYPMLNGTYRIVATRNYIVVEDIQSQSKINFNIQADNLEIEVGDNFSIFKTAIDDNIFIKLFIGSVPNNDNLKRIRIQLEDRGATDTLAEMNVPIAVGNKVIDIGNGIDQRVMPADHLPIAQQAQQNVEMVAHGGRRKRKTRVRRITRRKTRKIKHSKK